MQRSIALALITFLLIGAGNTPFDRITPASAYVVIEDNNIDADSDVDATANIGDDGATSYLDAQVLDGTDQIITEGNGTGYVAPLNVSDTFDSYTSDVDSSADKGIDASQSNAQATSTDSNYMTIQEANQGGAGGSEWLDVSTFDSTWSEWDNLVGTTPYVNAQDEPTNYIHEAKSARAQIGWFYFQSTTLVGSGISLNVSFYCRADDGPNDDGFEVYYDVTGSGGTLITKVEPDVTYSYKTITISGSFSDTDVNALRIYLDTVNIGGGDDIYVDHIRLGVFQTASTDYELDLEYQFTTADYDNTYEYLCVYVQTALQDNDQLIAYEWTGSDWSSLGTLSSDGWNNFTISYLTSATYTIRFIDSDQADEATQSTWNIDCIFIRTSNDEQLDYELNWEHQATSIDTYKDTFNLTIYGFSSDSETFSVWVWNDTDSTWYDTLLDIGSTEQWYNFTFTSDYYGTNGSTITWTYRGNSETGDTIQTTLRIDYAGIRYWNFTLNQFNNIDNADYKQGSGWELFDSMPLVITVTSGVNYNVEIRAVDGTGSPVTNEYLRFDIDSDPTGGTNLTTTYQTVFTNQPLGIDNTHNIYIFCAVPFGVDDQTMTFTLYIRIVEY